MRDNGQIYLYKDGVYRSEGTEAILGTKIRDAYYLMYKEKWKGVNTDFDLPEHIPKATVRYVNEVIAYIRAYTHITRETIDIFQEKYINFKNCLFNLNKWEFEKHTPGIKTICQIPVNYYKKAKCPHITNFLKDVAKPEDIAFLEEWAGYCLTTDVSYQKALMLYGIPGTGKSVFATMLETFISGENASSESLQKIEEDKYRAAKLYGKRVNICSDIPSTKMHKTEVFKKLVSGLDTIDAENKYQDPFKFKNKAKLTFSANKIPEGPKDPVFYERFCLIEFGNKFRGTDKDDKRLIQKLTTNTELSGFLNVVLEGLKRLYENDKFSYNKTFEETEREYILNSNPVAFFMEECTKISDQDIDGTFLYLSYADWSTKNNKPRVSNIEFSRRLNKMGYTSHRENVKSDGSKKVTVWENLQLKPSENNSKQNTNTEKKDDFGQDPGQDQDNRSCPKKSSLPLMESSQKKMFGQDQNPCVDFVSNLNNSNCDNIETVKAARNEENENTPNELKRSCPSVRFFDSGEYGQDVSKHPVLDPVREQKTLVFEQNEEENSMKIFPGCDLMRTDLKNFARSRYNLIVRNIPVFVGEFNAKYPGYKQKYGQDAVLFNAEMLSSRGWK
jgi:putative DNA primase/helicase